MVVSDTRFRTFSLSAQRLPPWWPFDNAGDTCAELPEIEFRHRFRQLILFEPFCRRNEGQAGVVWQH